MAFAIPLTSGLALLIALGNWTGQRTNMTGLVVRSSRIESLLMTHKFEGISHCATVVGGLALESEVCSGITLDIYIEDCAAVIWIEVKPLRVIMWCGKLNNAVS